MSKSALPFPPGRIREWVAIAGVTLVLVALVLWSGAEDARASQAWAAVVPLLGAGLLLERRSAGLRRIGHILVAGGIAAIYGFIFSAHRDVSFAVADLWWFAVLLLALVGEVITHCAGRRSSALFAAVGFGLCAVSAALRPSGPFYLISAVALAASAGWFLVRHGGAIVAWIVLPILYAGFFVWWPYSEGRVDADRYLALNEWRSTLASFAVVWALFAWNGALARFPSGRLRFVTLNDALFVALGLLIVPPAFPAWRWKFMLGFGVALLVAGALTRSAAEVRRGYFLQGGLLVGLGVVSALTGGEVAALLAFGSAFCVLSVARREHWPLRDLACSAGALAAVCVGFSLQEKAPHGLRLGAIVGAVLVGCACWIAGRRALWGRWAVAAFTALGLGVWLLTTLHFTAETQRAPVLAAEAVLLTLSFATLGVREIPWLAKAFSLGALLVWAMQLEAFVRPWWHPVALVLATLFVSHWWQTRGRGLIPAWEVRWVQAIAAAASATILLHWIESRVGREPAALIAMSALAVAGLLFAVAMRDRFLAAFSQLFTIAAVGEFIGQHTAAPPPHALAALAPIVALPILAPIARTFFADTEWERPVRGVAALYGALAAAMLVVWMLHYIPPPDRFVAIASVAMLLLLWTAAAHPRGPLLASLLGSTGALLAFWLGGIGRAGFLWRDLFAFILLLGFGVIGRRARVLPELVRHAGIVIGLASVVQWVSLCSAHHWPAAPLAAVWSIVALIVIALGWWLDEPLYRGVAWALLGAALLHLFFVDAPGAPAFRVGLLAVGAAGVVAAASYGRRASPASQ